MRTAFSQENWNFTRCECFNLRRPSSQFFAWVFKLTDSQRVILHKLWLHAVKSALKLWLDSESSMPKSYFRFSSTSKKSRGLKFGFHMKRILWNEIKTRQVEIGRNYGEKPSFTTKLLFVTLFATSTKSWRKALTIFQY